MFGLLSEDEHPMDVIAGDIKKHLVHSSCQRTGHVQMDLADVEYLDEGMMLDHGARIVLFAEWPWIYVFDGELLNACVIGG